jgi:hypothetical protein
MCGNAAVVLAQENAWAQSWPIWTDTTRSNRATAWWPTWTGATSTSTLAWTRKTAALLAKVRVVLVARLGGALTVEAARGRPAHAPSETPGPLWEHVLVLSPDPLVMRRSVLIPAPRSSLRMCTWCPNRRTAGNPAPVREAERSGCAGLPQVQRPDDEPGGDAGAQREMRGRWVVPVTPRCARGCAAQRKVTRRERRNRGREDAEVNA